MGVFDKNHIKIIAKDLAEFNKLEESLIGLSDEVKKDLDSIESSLAGPGPICTFKKTWDSKKIDVNLPRNIELIRHEEDVITAFSGNWVFKILVQEGSKVNYNFI